MSARIIAAALAVVFAVGTFVPIAQADWLSRIASLTERTAARGAARGLTGIEAAASHLKGLPATKGTALAAHASQEGHWTFVNKAGERFTAGTPDELKRAIGVLAPESVAGGKTTILLTEDTVFRERARLGDLPRGAELMVAFADEAYPLVRRGAGASETLLAEVRPNLLVELADRKLFDETAWQLARPLEGARIRVLALEPGGPVGLAGQPKLDAQTKRALTDMIDPERLGEALRSIPGQTVVLTGRVEGEKLAYRAASGSERSLELKPLMAAAEAADVNLVILKSSAPRQPGVRNWLWQRAAVDGLDRAMQRAHLADFLNALGADQSRFVVSATAAANGRVTLRAVPDGAGRSSISGLGLSDVFSEIASEVAGKVVTSGIEASMRSSERQRELDNRILPGIPSDVQGIYLAFFLLGVIGWPVSGGWWSRIWPAETRESYGNLFGYWAAQAVRGVLFAAVFMPAVAVASAPIALAHNGWRSLAKVLALLTWPFRRAGAKG